MLGGGGLIRDWYTTCLCDSLPWAPQKRRSWNFFVPWAHKKTSQAMYSMFQLLDVCFAVNLGPPPLINVEWIVCEVDTPKAVELPLCRWFGRAPFGGKQWKILLPLASPRRKGSI